MEKLPIYDATAPIVCTLSTAELEERLRLFERMRSSMTELNRTEHGILLRFPPGALLERELRAFVADEKACCAFWGFSLAADAEALTLRWDAPASARPALERIAMFFNSDEPATALEGIL